MGLIQKYILPKEVDFNRALQQQVGSTRHCVLDLVAFCQHQDQKALSAIVNDEHQSRILKTRNMHELLDVFITPYDKESIYRIVTQLDWVALSVKHLVIELVEYKVSCPEHYQSIFQTLTDMVEYLDQAFNYLPEKKLKQILKNAEKIHDKYDRTVKYCALATIKHLEQDEIKVYLIQKEILNQLKEVAKRIHISANTLEDMAMKIV